MLISKQNRSFMMIVMMMMMMMMMMRIMREITVIMTMNYFCGKKIDER